MFLHDSVSECKLFNHITAHDINCSVRFVSFHVFFPVREQNDNFIIVWAALVSV